MTAHRFASRLAVSVVVAASLGVLTGCVIDEPGNGLVPSSGAPVERSTQDTESAERAETFAPPAEWTDEELIGACKAADDGLDATRSWDDYSSDPDVTNSGDVWTVTIAALDGSDPLICEVTGTPESSTVSFR